MAIDADDITYVLRLLTPANRLVCRLAVSTGLRISDCLAITRRQLDVACNNRGYVTVRESKTGHTRRVYVDKALRADMRYYCIDASPYCFPGRLDATAHRTRQAVWKDLTRAAKALRYDGQVSPHSLRKVAAQGKLQAAGGRQSVVQRWLGHSDPAITAIYTLAQHAHMTKFSVPRKRA